MQLVIAEKPSVARDLARVLGVGRHAIGDGRRTITWCIGHLVELEEPAAYPRVPCRCDSPNQFLCFATIRSTPVLPHGHSSLRDFDDPLPQGASDEVNVRVIERELKASAG